VRDATETRASLSKKEVVEVTANAGGEKSEKSRHVRREMRPTLVSDGPKGTIPFLSRATKGGEKRSFTSHPRVTPFCVLKSPPRRQILHQDCSNVLQAFDSDILFSECDHVADIARYSIAYIVAKTNDAKSLKIKEHLNSEKRGML